MYRLGMGDVLNPTAGTALDCGFLAGGVFKPECWCLSFPALCPSADYAAAQALANPSVYAPIQQPPAPPAVGQALSTLPMPYQCESGTYVTAATNCPEYTAALDASIAAQSAAQKAQATATLAQTAANLQAVAAGQPSLVGGNCVQSWITGVCDTWVYVGAGIGVLFLVMTFGRR